MINEHMIDKSWEDFPFIQEEDGQRKKAICLQCEHMVEHLTCALCTCFLPSKIQLFMSKCDADKW
jgi:hypothetical protein